MASTKEPIAMDKSEHPDALKDRLEERAKQQPEKPDDEALRMANDLSQGDPSLAKNALAFQVAYEILKGFDKHYRLFQNISAEASVRFTNRDWSAGTKANVERIKLYDVRVKEATHRVNVLLDAQRHDSTDTENQLWVSIKRIYIGLLYEHKQPELAETFYNSVACRVLARDYYHNRYIFFRPAINTDFLKGHRRTFHSYYPSQTPLHELVRQILDNFKWSNAWQDMDRDIDFFMSRFKQLIDIDNTDPNFQIQILSSPFYRNKAAYVIGRVINGIQLRPIVLCIQHDSEGKLTIDAVLTQIEDIYTLFSFTRAYFMVDMDVPSANVDFLHSVLPRRHKSEMYTMLGLQKQGKTMFYRDLSHHLDYSFDDFVIAPGIRGMVMEVFVLPSFPYVFKIIKDYFAPPKDPDRQIVKDKYQLVKNHDRVGRLADTLEFTKVAFPLDRISPSLLSTLQATCASSISLEGKNIIIDHLYIERRMVPLNIYLSQANEAEKIAAIDGYGQAIRDLAHVNIFPGDMLLKNFGVTKGGRVVFYDYDEICYITDCKFRKIPPPNSAAEEMLDQTYYSVGANDVFPEQFSQFAFPDPKQREIFLQKHADLLDAAWWRARKKAIESGQQESFYPYPARVRNTHDASD